MSKFKIGDKVRVVNENEDSEYGSGGGHYFCIGETGVVIFDTQTDEVNDDEVNDDEDAGHDPIVRVKFDDGNYRSYWARESELELVTDNLFSEVSDAAVL